MIDILKSGNSEKLKDLNQEDIDVLVKRGHITSLPPDLELERFKEFSAALHQKWEREVKHGGIMLLMSYNCNLACKYCYQQEHRPHKSQAVMTPAQIEGFFERHLPQIIPGADYKNFDVSFYGGEPFLPANEAVIRKTLEYTKKHSMPASSISNATKVDSMADIFGPGPGFVNHVQISLDGSSALHDTSRIPVSGEKTFDKITDNIAMLLSRRTKISIRLNLNRRTLASVPRLIEELKAKNILGNKYASIYASPLHDNVAKVDTTDFMDLAELSSQVFDLGIDLEHPVSLRAHEMGYLFQLEKGIGLIHTCFCMQTMQHTVVLDPFGDLYACFEEAGYPEFRVGHVSESGVKFFPLHETYKTRHIANMDECLKCSVALACGGQCGVRCRAKTGDLFKPHCSDMKRVILDGIKLAYQKKKQNPGFTPPSHGNGDTVSVHG
ncbi:MAG: hypothetical protein A2X35_07745 [Elusimicrobia bacterium GWA2_61_42]|nr:MAG: hypothetical protein A2X35_07745 [Elusimicrobia bacterium GWA2_61_42]OGR77964.1 MAG: hypothetical protein A2X38_10775 [Elusimicrobia bacterium GWC2_61_25]